MSILDRCSVSLKGHFDILSSDEMVRLQEIVGDCRRAAHEESIETKNRYKYSIVIWIEDSKYKFSVTKTEEKQ